MEINLAETIRHFLGGITDVGGLQILLVILIVEGLLLGWILLLRHKAAIAHMSQLTQMTIASMEEQTKRTVAGLEAQTKLMVASLERQKELNKVVLELSKTAQEMKNEVQRMGLEQSEARW